MCVYVCVYVRVCVRMCVCAYICFACWISVGFQLHLTFSVGILY